MPPGIAIALYVVRFLISYACHIAAMAEECAVRGDISPVTIPFCKAIEIDALIIRVARGLRRALAMQDMLLQRAATGRDLEPVSRTPRSGPSGRRKNAADQQPQIERLPSAAEIAAELQRRPLGEIVAAICHDIGIVPSDMTDEQWDALQWVIHEYGGSLMKLWPAMRNTLIVQTEAAATDPDNAGLPHLPLIPWTRQKQLGRLPPGAHPP